MNSTRLLSVLLDLGESMAACGAEINRVEDTLSRMAKAYGATKTDVFVITSSIVFTMTFREDESYTMSRRMTYSGGTDFLKLEKLNALSRQCCRDPLPLDELKEKIDSIISGTLPLYLQFLSTIIGAGAFTIFFGGSLWDALFADAVGILVILFSLALPKLVSNKTPYYLICSALAGLIIYPIGNLTDFFLIDKVAIGVVMLLIPGIATTNAVRDMLTGDTISGTLKLIQCIIWALMIACGFMLSFHLTGSNAAHIPVVDSVYQLIPAFFGSMGFALMFNLRWKYMPYACLGGLICWAIYLLCELHFGLSVFWCSLVAAVFADAMSHLLARFLKTPATLFLIPLVVPLIPGSSLYYASSALVSSNIPDFWHYGLTTVLVVLGIAFGIGISANILDPLFHRTTKQSK